MVVTRIPYRRLLTLARPEWPMLIVATFSLLVASLMNLAYPQVIQMMIDAVREKGDLSSLNQTGVLLVIMFVVQSLFVALRAGLFTIAGERVVARLRGDLFSAFLRQDVAFFDSSRTGELTNRLASDTTVLQNAVTVNVSMALRFALGAVGGVAAMAWTSPRLTLLSMAVVPVVAIGAAWYGRMLRKLGQQVQDALAKSTEVAEEALSSLRTVRAFARERQEVERYRKSVWESYQLAANRAVAIGAFNGLGGLAGFLTVAGILWYGGTLVIDHQMTDTDLGKFLMYTAGVGISLGTLASLWGDFMKSVGASERVFELMDQVAPLEQSGGTPLTAVRGDVEFKGVGFAYPTRSDVDVLVDFNLKVSQGEVVALVGPSGSGKSTIASLLLRFYDPKAGSVSVDGRDVKSIEPHSLRENIAIVSQEPVLFATSIAENIRYGRPEATMEEVEAAAKAANAEEFIRGFPEGFQTAVGERGVQLSGGQKQRVAIARALLKDPPILILDEATSALDSESEHLVQDALERLMKGRTTLVIAHRLSTVQGADRLVVLNHGRVAEAGTHQELLARKDIYWRLVQRQTAHGELVVDGGAELV